MNRVNILLLLFMSPVSSITTKTNNVLIIIFQLFPFLVSEVIEMIPDKCFLRRWSPDTSLIIPKTNKKRDLMG